MLRVALGFYGLMLAAGLGLIAWRRGPHFRFDPFAPPGGVWPLWLALAVGGAFAVHVLSRFGLRRWPVFRAVAQDARVWFGGLAQSQLWLLAVCSGVAEEVFFRGWLLNEAGLAASSLVFGAVHVPPSRHWRLWPFFAAAIGLALGALCVASGTLVFAIAAHALINGLNLRLLARGGDA